MREGRGGEGRADGGEEARGRNGQGSEPRVDILVIDHL